MSKFVTLYGPLPLERRDCASAAPLFPGAEKLAVLPPSYLSDFLSKSPAVVNTTVVSSSQPPFTVEDDGVKHHVHQAVTDQILELTFSNGEKGRLETQSSYEEIRVKADTWRTDGTVTTLSMSDGRVVRVDEAFLTTSTTYGLGGEAHTSGEHLHAVQNAAFIGGVVSKRDESQTTYDADLDRFAITRVDRDLAVQLYHLDRKVGDLNPSGITVVSDSRYLLA